MKKRSLFILFLVGFFLYTRMLPSGNAANMGICFIAVDNTVLELRYTPYFEESTAYFSSETLEKLRIYTTYDTDSGFIEVTNGSIPVYFDPADGGVYDALGSNIQGESIIYRGNQYLFPANYITSLYNMSCHYIAGTDFDALRVIKEDSILSNEQFIKEATPMMWELYYAYTRTPTASPTISPPLPPLPTSTVQVTYPVDAIGTPSPSIAPTPVATPSSNRSDTDIYITFQGLPSVELLNILEKHWVHAGFFATAKEIEENPDIVRRLTGLGHTIGVLYTGDPDAYMTARTMIYDAAHIYTLLITSTQEYAEDCEAFAKEQGLINWTYRIDALKEDDAIMTVAELNTEIDQCIGRVDLRLYADRMSAEEMGQILSHLKNIKYNICAVRETNHV